MAFHWHYVGRLPTLFCPAHQALLGGHTFTRFHFARSDDRVSTQLRDPPFVRTSIAQDDLKSGRRATAARFLVRA